jgi:hypothetical protein
LGWFYGRAWPRQRWVDRDSVAGGSAYGVVLWLALELSVALWGDGPGAAISSAVLLLASAEVYGIGLVGLASILDTRTAMAGGGVLVVDRGRRIVVLGGLTGGALVLTGGALARMLVSNAEQPTTEPAQAEVGPAVTRDPETPTSAENATAEAVANSNGAKMSIALPPGVSEEITPNERFYLVSKNFNDPRVGADKWSLEVFGLVAQPQRFSYTEILALPTMSQYTTLECISNALGGKLSPHSFQ